MEPTRELQILEEEYEVFVQHFMRDAPLEVYWEYRAEYKKERTRLAAKIRATRLRIARSLGTHSKEEWERLKQKFGNICVACFAEVKLTKDHIIPVLYGSSDSIDNIQPLCLPCNVRKSAGTTNYLSLFEKIRPR